MFHLRKFNTYRDYKAYLQAGDIYLPRVSLIVNAGDHATSVDRTNSQYGPTWIDYSRVGSKFVEIANGDYMFFTNQYGVDGLFDYVAVENSPDDIELHVYHAGTEDELMPGEANYDKYAIKVVDDKLVFPNIERVAKADALLEENLFYVEDIAKLDDPNFHLGE